MIVWTGWGILAPFLIFGGILVATAASGSAFGPGYANSHHWVTAAGLAMGGILCWMIGFWRNRRDTRLYFEAFSDRPRRTPAPHTLFLIPMHWVGIAALLGAIPLGMHGMPQLPQSPLAPLSPQKAAATEQVASVQYEPLAAAQFASATDAQREAVRVYPDLAVPGSEFNRAFVALHKKYQEERPELLEGNNWPIVIAQEVAKKVK